MNAVEGGVGVGEGLVHVPAFAYLPHCSSVDLSLVLSSARARIRLGPLSLSHTHT
jgi:hypothetical protein